MLETYKQQIIDGIRNILAECDVVLTTPPSLDKGDFALPCFPLAKALRKKPDDIAADIKKNMPALDFIEKIEVSGGYCNFFLKRIALMRDVIKHIQKQQDTYGSSRSGSGKKALVEHTSINPNASPHVGRARNALIGDALVRMMRFEGFAVDTHYYVDDVGKQIAMLVVGAKARESVSFDELLSLYVDINKRIADNPQLEQEVFDTLHALERGDEKTRTMFHHLVGICVQGQMRIFKELGIEYDTFTYESDYIFNKSTDDILRKLQQTGKLFEDSEGRKVLNQEDYDLPIDPKYFVLTRADKTTLYPLRDIAYTIDKLSTGAEVNIIVLGEDQKLYFQQLGAALDVLGYEAPRSVHYSFILLKDGKMSTRKGTVVLLEDFMKEALRRAKQGLEKRGGAMSETTARAIAYGAVKYAVLKVANDRNVIFDWESALNFEGDTGPYLQYSHARINSIFRKYGKDVPDTVDLSLLKEKREYELARELAGFPGIVRRALEELSPNVIANYTYSVAKKFAAFYHEHQVINADTPALTEARLALIGCVRQVLKNGMSLLGIEPVEAM